MTDRKIPELLSPAGGWQHLEAAVQNGADAVYIGGPLFNARIKAENFTDAEMREAVRYAHLRNVKVYAALNTLVRDSDLEKAFACMNALYEAGADAVIIQDMGLVRLAVKYMPDMPVHLSTQGTVCGSHAVDTVKDMGVSRIVAAREMSMDDIRSFTEKCHEGTKPCRAEIFAHGALCMCYSGQCHMSRVIGGSDERSGNRGTCAQPCRLPYKDENGADRFLLSPKDICTLQMLPEIAEAGVDAVKIEGRLRSPQYVAVVTSIYRKYLDMYKDTGGIEISGDDLGRLLQIFNRGGFAEGYLNGNPGEALLSGDSPKNAGILVGKVKGARDGSTLIDVATEDTPAGTTGITMGDGVEIRGRDVTGNVVTYLKRSSDGSLRIGDIKGRVHTGDNVYKVTDKKLLDEAERSYLDSYGKKVPVSMKFTAAADEHPVLVMWEKDAAGEDGGTSTGIRVTERSTVKAQRAVNTALTPERAKEQLAKLGGTVFTADPADISTELDDSINVPISEINRLRRQASKRLAEKKAEAGVSRHGSSSDAQERICREERLATDALPPIERRSIFLFGRKESEECCRGRMTMDNVDDVYVPLEIYMESVRSGNMAEGDGCNGAALVPYILNVSKGRLDEYIEENFEDIVSAVRDCGIMACGLSWIKDFLEAGIKVYGGYGLNVYNVQCLRAFTETGVEIRAYSHEADWSYCGDIPLMITEHPVTAETFQDRKGARYRVQRWHSGDKYLIFKMTPGRGDSAEDSSIKYIAAGQADR